MRHRISHSASLTETRTESQPTSTVVGCIAEPGGANVAGLADKTSSEARPANPTGPQAAVTLHLPSSPDSPMIARRRLVALERTLAPETMAKLRLLVTELVANSVRHASGTPIDVKVTVDETCVRTEVTDGGTGFVPPRPDPSPMKTHGWGLFLVRKIAARWGAEPATGTVWFEIER